MTVEESTASHTSVMGIISWVFNSLELWPPPGLRHHATPAIKAMVRNCVLLQHDLVQRGGLVPRELSVHFAETKMARSHGSFRKMMTMGALWRSDSGGDIGCMPISRTNTGTPFLRAAAALSQHWLRGGERPPQIPEEASPEDGTNPRDGLPMLKMASSRV